MYILFHHVLIAEMGKHMQLHGDGAKDIAFEVQDLAGVVEVIISTIWVS